MINGIIQAILVTFSMIYLGHVLACCLLKMMISNSKNCEKHKKHMHHVHHSSRARRAVLSLQTSLLLTRNMNVEVAIEL